MKNNAVTDQEKREKKIVVKKLAEMEEELKVYFRHFPQYFPVLTIIFSASGSLRELNRPGWFFVQKVFKFPSTRDE